MRLPFAILAILALLSALCTAEAHFSRERDLQVICNTTSVVSESKYADNLFLQSVVNAVAAGCKNTRTWKGARNYWGVKDLKGQDRDVKDLFGGSPHIRRLLKISEQPLVLDDEHDDNNGSRRQLLGAWTKYKRMKASFKRWGLAYARAIAYTQITCTSYDPNDPYQCTESEVQANAAAKARAKFVAKAAALAFTQCGKCQLTAEAQAALSAELLLQLTARATARVDAKVCVGAGGTASATGYMNCFGLSIARGMAKAVAVAMIKGNCFLGVEASARVQAEVDADADDFCACEGWMDVSADAGTGGQAFAQVNTNGTCDSYVEEVPTA